MLPARRRLSSQPQFTPRKIFAAMRGAWLEPVLGNMWQENTGITPVSAPGHPVGLLLDQSQGMVLGPELVTNGDFSNGTTGWGPDPGATLSVSTGQLTISVDGANSAGCSQSISTVIGATYQISVNVIYVSAGTQSISAGTSIRGSQLFVSYSATLGDRIGKFIATTTTTYICWSCGSSSRSAIIDNISVKQVLGNHAYQATAANRPTYQLDANSLPLIRHDTNDVLTVSLPNLGGGVFSNSGSVYFATPQGMSALHGQSMGTTLNLPALSSDIYAWCVTPARLNAEQEAMLQLYFNRNSGIVEPDYLLDDTYGVLLQDDGVEAIYRG